MKSVKSFAELAKSGADVEGLRFVEVKDKQTVQLNLEAVLERIDRNSDTLEAALYASVKAIADAFAGQNVKVEVVQPAVHRWVFDFERDREGFMKRIVATADRGH